MPYLPAYCLQCDITFESAYLFEPNGANNTVTNCYSKCPQCKEPAKVLEGNFTITPENRIDMKSGMPPITRSMLEKFDLLTRDAMRDNKPLPEYAIEASKIHPYFAKIVSKAAKLVVKNKKTTGVFGLVLFALAYCSSGDIQDIVDISASGEVRISAQLRFEAVLDGEKLFDKLSDGLDRGVKQIESGKPGGKSDPSAGASGQKDP